MLMMFCIALQCNNEPTQEQAVTLQVRCKGLLVYCMSDHRMAEDPFLLCRAVALLALQRWEEACSSCDSALRHLLGTDLVLTCLLVTCKWI